MLIIDVIKILCFSFAAAEDFVAFLTLLFFYSFYTQLLNES